MITTKTTPKGWLLTLLSAIFLLSGLTACSSTEGDESSKEPLKPDTPINNDDWQTIPVSGGTIEKGDLTITFPNGTFSKDVKVAVSEVEAGQICGDDEISKFYQITMPASTTHSFSLKLKCEEKGDNIKALLHSPVVPMTDPIETYDNITIESTFDNGEYKITLPSFENGESTENISISIGIARMATIEGNSSDTRSNTRKSDGQVGNIEWHYDIQYVPYKYMKANWNKTNMSKHVVDALSHIKALGFEIDSHRDIPIKFDVLVTHATWKSFFFGFGEDVYGYMNQSKVHCKFNSITLNRKFIIEYGQGEWTEDLLRRTLIHELLHYFQAEYDPRLPIVKAWAGGNEWLQLYESGAVWCEKFNANGKPSSAFISQNITFFSRSLTNLKEVYNNDVDYATHGYGMAALLEYISTHRVHENFNNRSVVELYEQWNTRWSELGPQLIATKATFDIIKNWVESPPHNSNLFIDSNYDDFILSLAKEKVVEGVHVGSIPDIKNPDYRKENYYGQLEKDGILSFKEKCYPYGCFIMKIHLSNSDTFKKKGSFDKRKLIIEQNEEGVQTYVLYKKGGEWIQVSGTAVKGKPLEIDGKTLESFHNNDGYNALFYPISTNIKNKETLTSDVIVNLTDSEERDLPSVSPTSVSFEAEGGTDTTVKINKGSYKYCDAEVPEEFEKWLSAKASNDGTVSITAQLNTGEEREGKIKCWVSNKENPSPADKKYIDPSVTVTQKAGDDESLFDPTDLVFPVEGGVRCISYKIESDQWLARRWEDDTWLKTGWSIDYLDKIRYYPSKDNRFTDQLYVCCFPNETGEDREQTITFGYSKVKGLDFDKRDKYPFKVKQEGGTFNLDMMKNLFVGSWYTAKDIDYNKNEGQFYHKRYTFRADHTLTYEGQYTFSDAKPSSWIEEFSGTYSVLSYEVRDRCVVVKIKIPSKDTWYKGYLECWPHWLFFGYENSDGSISHGFYMERE